LKTSQPGNRSQPVAPFSHPSGPFWGRGWQKGPVPPGTVLACFDFRSGCFVPAKIVNKWLASGYFQAHIRPSQTGSWPLSVMRTPVALPPSSDGKERAMEQRRRFKQQLTLQDRLSAWAKAVRVQANQLCPGPERDMLLRKARQADTASHLQDWANSPGLQSPK
jgi:hypothetical protein